VISNCVINLSTDKPAVFAEAFRVLRPSGRLGITDVVADDHLDAAQRAERGSYVACIAGALGTTEYRDGLLAAGFTDVTITTTHNVADGMNSAIITATKPVTDSCCGVNHCCSPAEHAADPHQSVTQAKTSSGCGCITS
jgi:arsenite methyltransferase